MLDTVKDAPGKALESVTGSWGRLRRYLAEVRTELTRVTWPSRKEVWATTLVVILTSIFFGLYLFLIDIALSSSVKRIFQLFGGR